MTALWRVGVALPDASTVATVLAALEAGLESVSAFESDAGGWQIEGLSRAPVDRAGIEVRLALALAALGGRASPVSIERLPARDWLGENQAAFPPLAVGRYFIHGAQHRGRVPAGRIGLLIDAATAFGTGEHASTQGCLVALDRLARGRRRRRVLDMGSGSGILAIAAAKTWRRPVVAADIDAEAVRVSRHNARRNGVGACIEARRVDGYRDRRLRRAAPYDLVFANILARPLMLMARELRAVLDRGGIAVLSGLLARQERAVLAAHRRLRFVLLERIRRAGWHTLVLARGRPAGPALSVSPGCERP